MNMYNLRGRYIETLDCCNADRTLQQLLHLLHTDHVTVMLCSAHINVPEGLWLIGNVDFMGFYRTNYDVSMWKRIIDQLHTDHTVRTPQLINFLTVEVFSWTA